MRRAKGVTLEESEQMVKDPLFYGNLLVKLGEADGSVAGATNTTAHTVRAALHCIGIRQGFRIVSSFFVMVLPDPRFGAHGALIYADCGVVTRARRSWRKSPSLRLIRAAPFSASSRASPCSVFRPRAAPRTN